VDLAIILVHYFTPDLVEECVAALRQDLEGSGLNAEWVLVDNGSDEGSSSSFEDLGLRVLSPGENLGYAGGINLGVSETTAPILLVLNPDVLVLDGCIGALMAELEAGAVAAGPRLFWDREQRLLLPVNEVRTRRRELQASLAETRMRQTGPVERSWSVASRARRAWRRHARRHWQAQEPLESYELSGAILALRRDAWDRLGPFDEGFRLYFEETDWLERLRRSDGPSGYQSRHVPAAQAVHLYNQSGSQESRAGAWFAASRERFHVRHYGRWFFRLIRWLESRSTSKTPAPEIEEDQILREAPLLELPEERPLWVEISPRRVGFPAAAERVTSRDKTWQLPRGVWDGMAPGEYWLRTVSDSGAEISLTRWHKG